MSVAAESVREYVLKGDDDDSRGAVVVVVVVSVGNHSGAREKSSRGKGDEKGEVEEDKVDGRE